jgi:hypothetical protein
MDACALEKAGRGENRTFFTTVVGRKIQKIFTDASSGAGERLIITLTTHAVIGILNLSLSLNTVLSRLDHNIFRGLIKPLGLSRSFERDYVQVQLTC